MHGTRGMDTILATHIHHHGLGHGAARTTIRDQERTHGHKLLAARRAFNHVLHGGGWGPPPTTSLTKRDVAVYEGRFGRSLTLRRDYNRQMPRGYNRQVLRGGASGSKRQRGELREDNVHGSTKRNHLYGGSQLRETEWNKTGLEKIIEQIPIRFSGEELNEFGLIDDALLFRKIKNDDNDLDKMARNKIFTSTILPKTNTLLSNLQHIYRDTSHSTNIVFHVGYAPDTKDNIPDLFKPVKKILDEDPDATISLVFSDRMIYSNMESELSRLNGKDIGVELSRLKGREDMYSRVLTNILTRMKKDKFNFDSCRQAMKFMITGHPLITPGREIFTRHMSLLTFEHVIKELSESLKGLEEDKRESYLERLTITFMGDLKYDVGVDKKEYEDLFKLKPTLIIDSISNGDTLGYETMWLQDIVPEIKLCYKGECEIKYKDKLEEFNKDVSLTGNVFEISKQLARYANRHVNL